MATIAKLNVLLSLDDSGFARSLENTRKKLDSWGSSLRNVGTKMTAGITAPLAGAGVMFVKWAADLEQSIGATEHLWGSNAESILAWSKSASTALGMSEDEALTTANRLNGIFRGMGLSMDETEAKTMELSARFADLSALMGGSPTEAAEAYTSALMGNYQALDKYNININAAMVEQRALTMTGKESVAQLTAEEKQLAFNALYLEKTADAHGQFGREADTTTGKLTRLNARLKNIATSFGTLLLPVVNKAADYLEKLIKWVENLSDTQRKWILGIAAVAAAMGPLLVVIGMILPGISALVAVIGFLLSPIGLVVIAVAALVAGLVWAYFEFEGFRNVVNAVASVIKDSAIAAFEALVNVFKKLKSAFDAGGFSQMFSTLGDMLLNGLSQLSNLAMQGIQWLADKFLEGVSSASSAAWSWIQGLADGALGKWNEFTAWLGGLAAEAVTWIGDTTATLKQKGTDILQGFWDGVTEKWVAVSTWFVELAGMVFTAVADTTSKLKSRGTDILQGFWQGVLDKWVAVSLWFTNLATMVFNAVGDTLTKLKSRGTDILQGFWSGVTDKWFAVSLWFSSLGGMIASAVGNLASSLYNAGVAVMQGLWDGLKAKWGDITNWLSGLNPADWKGPERRDKKMLYEPGLWIMQGLSRGLGEGWDDVTRQLSGYVPTINGNGSLAGAGAAGGQVIQIITLEPGRWQEFLADAQAGGTFARQFGTELAMMEGVG